MPRKKSGVEKLLQDTPARVSGRSLKKSLPRKVYQAIESDLLAIVKAERDGRQTPSVRQIVSYIQTEYDTVLSYGGVYEWLRRVRDGGQNV